MKRDIFEAYVDRVTDRFGISRERLFAKDKSRDVVDARHMLYYLCSERPMTNTYIKPQENGPGLEAMVKDVGEGIYAKGSLGGYVMDGEFAFWPKEAYRIEGGEVQYDKPIKGLILKGHTLTTLKSIAEMTAGKYFRATDNRALRNIYQEIDELERTKIEVTAYKRVSELFSDWLWAGAGLILLELLLSMTVFRRTV